MDPSKLPAGTEFSFQHLFTPVSSVAPGFMVAPINPHKQVNHNMSLPDLQPRNDKMTLPPQRRGPKPSLR